MTENQGIISHKTPMIRMIRVYIHGLDIQLKCEIILFSSCQYYKRSPNKVHIYSRNSFKKSEGQPQNCEPNCVCSREAKSNPKPLIFYPS